MTVAVIVADERFWSKVAVAGPDDCWEWQASVDGSGYGQFAPPRNGEKKRTVRAHRVAYMAVHGAIPPTVLLCHRCDNPRCVNPAHLFPGSQVENMADCAAKGRASRVARFRGEAHPNATISDEDVRAIRLACGSLSEIAREFGVSKGHVWRIRRGLSR